MTEYGRIHTDGSRSGGQPLIANRKAHTMIIEVLAAWGIEPSNTTPEQLTIATTEALCRAIKQLEDLRQPTQSNVVVAAASADRIGGAGVVMDAEGVKIYWYRQGKDDGVEHERAKIVGWLREQQLATEKLRDEMNRHTAGWHFADEHASSLEQSANAIEAGEHLG